jgi:NADP-dependent aldehyde dehydrogenase
MLTEHIHDAYRKGLVQRSAMKGVTVAALGERVEGCRSQAALLVAEAEAVLAEQSLQEELFGPASVLVRCRDINQLCAVAGSLEGQLTATIHMEASDLEIARKLLPLLKSMSPAPLSRRSTAFRTFINEDHLAGASSSTLALALT